MLTGIFFVLALYFFTQPGSWVRNKWDTYRANTAMVRWAREHWGELAEASLPLYPGSDSASIIEISDFECPFCRASSKAVDSALNAGVRIAYLNYPLAFHAQAKGAAIAALCAANGGRFREMHDRLMQDTLWQRDSNWTRLADAAGVTDIDGFRKCVTSAEMQSRVEREQALVRDLQVRGTPTFLTPRSVHQGTITLDELLSLRDGR